MLPAPLAPLDPHKTRALTTIYAPRKLNTRKNKTVQMRMIDNDIQLKPSLSPFHPLPAIGQKLERSKTKVIVFDLNKSESGGTLDRSVKIRDVLKPLTPLRIHGFTRKSSLEQQDVKKPQQLLRENTYDVIKPLYVTSENVKVNQDDLSITKKTETIQPPPNSNSPTKKVEQPKCSPKTRFKKAALQVAKMSTMPETGKLLCLRERQTYRVCRVEEDKSICKLQELPQSPAQNLNKLSEIFQSLEMKGRHRDKMKKENSWF